jgi:hypothetical protein
MGRRAQARVLALGAGFAIGAPAALADEMTISSSLVGGFDAGGGYSNTLAFQNYFTGTTATGPTMDRRSFYIFSLPAALPGGITGATFIIRNPFLPSPGGGGTPGYFSDDAFETFRISDTPFPASFIAAPHTVPEALSIWSTLGTGELYGEIDVSSSSAGDDLEITLSGAALSYLNTHLGGAFVIGGQVATLDGSSPDELIFAYSDIPSPHMVEPSLRLTYLPTPGALTLMLLSAAPLGVRRRVR